MRLWRAPMQVEDHVDAAHVEPSRKVFDRPPVRLRGGGAADPEPAILVERQAHHVDIPSRDGVERTVVNRPVEKGLVLYARVLTACAVYAPKPHDAPLGVHEAIAPDVDLEWRPTFADV